MMFSHSHKRGFSIVELIVAIIIILILLSLLIPCVSSSREAARRNACINNMKELGRALQNFHDTRKCFPGSNSLPFSPGPGKSGLPLMGIAHGGALDTDKDGRYDIGTGFSWQEMIWPHLAPMSTFKNLTTVPTVDNFANSGQYAWYFTSPVSNNAGHSGEQLIKNSSGEVLDPPDCFPWHEVKAEFRCPSFSGDEFSVDNPLAAKKVKTPYTGDYKSKVTNYVALGATHRKSLWETNSSDADLRFQGGFRHPNGVMYPGSKTSIEGIKDGDSCTFLICETREITRAAKYEGATAAVVGLAGDPKFGPSAIEDVSYGVPIDAQTNLNRGRDEDMSTWYDPGNYVKSEDQSEGASGWIHGPSSEHPGVVNHTLADGTVKSISEDIDPVLYMHLITRNGYESISEFHDE